MCNAITFKYSIFQFIYIFDYRNYFFNSNFTLCFYDVLHLVNVVLAKVSLYECCSFKLHINIYIFLFSYNLR